MAEYSVHFKLSWSVNSQNFYIPEFGLLLYANAVVRWICTLDMEAVRSLRLKYLLIGGVTEAKQVGGIEKQWIEMITVMESIASACELTLEIVLPSDN